MFACSPVSRSRSVFAQLALILCAAFVLNACALVPEPPPAETPVPVSGQPQPAIISGLLQYTNDIFTSYATHHAVALVDLQGFVRRDADWEIPADSLAFGSLKLDEREQSGRYRLRLPAQPPGGFVDVDHNGKLDGRVQVFAVAAWNDPLTDQDQYHSGWPANLASTINDPERHDEITGGKLVIWAADASQQFPSDFGPDERLFTDDDPLVAVPAGYAVVDLNQRPFAFERGENPELPLYEQVDVAIKDFSDEPYSQAFRKLVDQLRREYAFNGIADKAPPWDALYDQLAPRVAEAEQREDAQAFFLALHDFALAFHDGHVAIDGGDLAYEAFDKQFGGGYGFAIRELDDGRFLVVYVLEDGPAAKAGMVAGAELTAFNDREVPAALVDVQPWNGPFSTELALRQAQQRYLVRAAVGATASVTFANPGQRPKTASLLAVAEDGSLDATSLYRYADPMALPIEYYILDSGLGYVRINSNDDDLDLINELFIRALDSFDYHEVPGVIVDLRQNDGGAPLYLADYMSKRVIELGQWEYYSEVSSRFEADGPRDQIDPVDEPYLVDKLAVLVDQSCFSACEVEAYGFSKLPGAIVVGQYPSAGVVADVARGLFWLPEQIDFQVSTGRYVLPDGALLIEGSGVVPTLDVPVDQRNALADEDVVLRAAEQALLKE